MNAVEEEVGGEPEGRIRQEIIQVEQEPVDDIFCQSPDEHSAEEVIGRSVRRQTRLETPVKVVGDDGQPKDGNHKPWGLGEDLKVGQSKDPCGALEVTRDVDLLQVERLGKVAVPELPKERLAEIEEL